MRARLIENTAAPCKKKELLRMFFLQLILQLIIYLFIIYSLLDFNDCHMLTQPLTCLFASFKKPIVNLYHKFFKQ